MKDFCISFIRNLVNNLLKEISYQKCHACNDVLKPHEEYLCETCYQKTKIKFSASTKSIDTNSIHGQKIQIFFASKYQNHVQELMRKFKYENPRIKKLWGKILKDYWEESIDVILTPPSDPDYESFIAHHTKAKNFITSIPLHLKKQKLRGYNQSSLIAKEFCKSLNDLNYIFIDNLLTRQRNTDSLFDKSKIERQEIMLEAFSTNKNFEILLAKAFNKSTEESSYLNVKKTQKNFYKRLIIIDDITTTGTTLYEAYKTMNKAKIFDEIILLAVAGNK